VALRRCQEKMTLEMVTAVTDQNLRVSRAAHALCAEHAVLRGATCAPARAPDSRGHVAIVRVLAPTAHPSPVARSAAGERGHRGGR